MNYILVVVEKTKKKFKKIKKFKKDCIIFTYQFLLYNFILL